MHSSNEKDDTEKISQSDSLRFKRDVFLALGRGTSAHKEEWSISNPWLGHCTVVSILAQDILGGNILRIDTRGMPGYWGRAEFHSWNELPGGEQMDFTVDQLEENVPSEASVRRVSREELFGYSNIKGRYLLLADRFHNLYCRGK